MDQVRQSQSSELSEQLRWSRRVAKGSSTTGWITVPQDLRPDCDVGQRFEIDITTEGHGNFYYEGTYRKNKASYGFYIPKEFVHEFDLFGTTVEIVAIIQQGFAAKVSVYKQIIIPLDLVEDHGLGDGDLVELRIEPMGDEITPG